MIAGREGWRIAGNSAAPCAAPGGRDAEFGRASGARGEMLSLGIVASGKIADGIASSCELSTAVSRGPRVRPLSRSRLSWLMISISGDESSVIAVLLAPTCCGIGGGVAARGCARGVGTREGVGTVSPA